MSNQTPALTDQQRIEHYFEILETCLEQCADARGESLNLFLWSARRASEAIAYALAEGTDLAKQLRGQSQVLNHVQFLGNLTKQGRVHPAMESHLGGIWATGSFGTHTQSPERTADETTLKSCVAALVVVADWFYGESVLARQKSAKVVRALQDLKAVRPRESAHARHARELAAAVEWLTAAELQLGVRVKELEAQLEQTQTRIIAVAPAPTAPVQGASPKLAVVATASLLFGTGAGWALWGPSASPAGHPDIGKSPSTLAAAAAPQALPMPSPATAPSPAILISAPLARPAASETTPPSPARRHCPVGTVRYAGEAVVFAHGPRRKGWGVGGHPPAPTGTVEFCLDSAPVTTAAFSAFLATQNRRPARLHHKPHCNLGEKANALPINCVTWTEATDYCEFRAARLPAIGEWEFARRVEPRVKLTPGTGEWASDMFPPVIFGFTADGHSAGSHLFFDERYTRVNLADAGPHEPNLSWSRAEPGKANSETSFRCASDPLP